MKRLDAHEVWGPEVSCVIYADLSCAAQELRKSNLKVLLKSDRDHRGSSRRKSR